MKIIFSNGVEMPYINAFSLERDYKDGYTRPSIEVTIPLSVTSFEQINSLMGMDFMLFGDLDETMVDEDGNALAERPMTEWKGYSIRGKITVDDDNITFKVYKLSESELVIEELLMIIAED